MRLSDVKGEKAILMMANLIGPISVIVGDTEVRKVIDDNSPRYKWVEAMLKRHPKEVIEVMAALNEKNADEFEVNLLTAPKLLLDILNDPEVASLFTSQGQEKTGNVYSGSVQGTIKEK